jgi:hypothetical protein
MDEMGVIVYIDALIIGKKVWQEVGPGLLTTHVILRTLRERNQASQSKSKPKRKATAAAAASSASSVPSSW